MKKYLLGFFAIVIASLFTAFTSKKDYPEPTAGEKWFLFDGISPDDLNDPASYHIDGGGGSPTICTSYILVYRCEILAVPENGPNPEPKLNTIIAETKKSTPD